MYCLFSLCFIMSGIYSERFKAQITGITVPRMPSPRSSWPSSRCPRDPTSAQREALTAFLIGSIGEQTLRWAVHVGRCATKALHDRRVRCAFSKQRDCLQSMYFVYGGVFMFEKYPTRCRCRCGTITQLFFRNRVPCTMVAASEQCQRHAAGAVSTIPSFSDDGVVQTVLKELQRVSEDQRTGTKPPLVSLQAPLGCLQAWSYCF